MKKHNMLDKIPVPAVAICRAVFEGKEPFFYFGSTQAANYWFNVAYRHGWLTCDFENYCNRKLELEYLLTEDGKQVGSVCATLPAGRHYVHADKYATILIENNLYHVGE